MPSTDTLTLIEGQQTLQGMRVVSPTRQRSIFFSTVRLSCRHTPPSTISTHPTLDACGPSGVDRGYDTPSRLGM